MKHRSLIITVSIVLCAVIVGVLYIFRQPPTISSQDFTTKDQVLAIRLSKTRTDLLDFNPNVGYLVLADASGNMRVFNTGSMPSSQPLWTDLDIFYAGAKSEFFTNDKGTKNFHAILSQAENMHGMRTITAMDLLHFMEVEASLANTCRLLLWETQKRPKLLTQKAAT